jgi:valyl-tRNA synthetase
LVALLAPFLPFVTEEVWSWWHDTSVHRSSWPDAARLRELAGDVDPALGTVAAEVLGRIRKAKTETKRSMRAEVARVEVTDTAGRLAALEACRADVVAAGVVAELVTAQGRSLSVNVIFPS